MPWTDPDDTTSNPRAGTAETVNDIIARTISRRRVLAGGAATAALTMFSGVGTAFAQDPEPDTWDGADRGGRGNRAFPKSDLLGFEGIETAIAPTLGGILLAEGYSAQFFAPWGDPVDGVSPAWADGGLNTADEQARQLGQGHDGMEYFPYRGSSEHGLLAINHEYTIASQLYPVEFYGDPVVTEEIVRKEQYAHGVSVVEVQRSGDEWQIVDGGLGRRITPLTEMTIAGPAAGHPLLRWGGRDGTTTNGTVNNCSSGQTPWGTYVTCEENFNGYFWLITQENVDAIVADLEADDQDDVDAAEEALNTLLTAGIIDEAFAVTDAGEFSDEQAELFERYGFETFGFGYPWGGFDPSTQWRADLHPGRTNTYGWNVEIDPWDQTSTPVKRTAMGRIKHEGATFTTGRGGRLVCYMGDDQRFDYLYKYVSDGNWRSMRARGISPLDEGTLYVARFDESGTGEWLAVDYDSQPSLRADPRFADQAEVLIKTRLAADVLGATPCDRPEWTAVHPATGEVYATFTNNSRRTQPEPANPVAPNPDGHIISIRESGSDNAATSFRWDVFVMGYDERTMDTFPGLPYVEYDAAFTDPDGLGFDGDGRLWIQTDGGQPFGMNDQMLAADPTTREIRRFFMGPKDCEVTGLTFTPDHRTMFINIQHPNDEVPPTNTDPAVYPEEWPNTRPRPSTVVITKDDGGVIGS